MKFLFINGAPIITHGLGPGLRQAGGDVIISQVPAALSRQQDFLHREIQQHRPDYVVVEGTAILKPYQVLFPVLKKTGTPMIYWAIDDPVEFKNFSVHMAKRSKYVLTTARECIPLYSSLGIRSAHMLFACLPQFHRRVEPEPAYNYDLIFVGNNYHWYPARFAGFNTILKPLLQGNYNIKVFGNEWWLDETKTGCIEPEYYGGYLGYEKLPAAYSTARIVLGMHSVNSSPTMMSMRTFEALGCGAFYLTQWTPAVESLFRNHVHLVWSRDSGETTELVDFYLKRPELRERIARRGQEEVYRHHTYLQRAGEMLKFIGDS